MAPKRSGASLLAFALLALAFGFSTTGARTEQQREDDGKREIEEAKVAYYLVPPRAVRRKGGKELFLFLTANPALVGKGFGGASARLILAGRDTQGNVTILWRYDLPEDGGDPLWWNFRPGESQVGILVPILGGTYRTFEMMADQPPTLTGEFALKPFDESLLLDPRTSFFARLEPGQPPRVFYSPKALLVLNVATGTTRTLWSAPRPRETSANFMAGQDLDGDGTLDIVGDTSRFFMTGGKPHYFPGIKRVWHYQGGTFKEIFAGKPTNSGVYRSEVISAGKGRFLIAAHEIHGGDQQRGDVIHLYRWNGRSLQEVASSENAAPLFMDFAAADLDGDGADELAVFTEPRGELRLAVLKLRNQQLVKVWESPDLHPNLEFGRVQDYDRDGKEEAALFLREEGSNYRGRVKLFEKAGGKFTGFETLRKPPPPPPPPPPPSPASLPPKLRFLVIEMGLANGEHWGRLDLDGVRLVVVRPTKAATDPVRRTLQIHEQILQLARERFPAGRVAIRPKEEDREIVAGDAVLVTLTPEDAEAAGKPLDTLAAEWLAAVRKVLRTLAAPPAK